MTEVRHELVVRSRLDLYNGLIRLICHFSTLLLGLLVYLTFLASYKLYGSGLADYGFVSPSFNTQLW